MDAISDFIKIVTTLLGIAYPILFQVVARLDEKYSSNLIVELFDKEFYKKCFKTLLITSLILILLWSLKIPSLVDIKGLNYLINNSAAILIIIATTLLVISFFLFVNRIMIYYTPSKFINYLIKGHDRSDINLTNFKALTDVFLHFIKKQNGTNSMTIARFFYDVFKAERDNSNGKPVLYPDSYYIAVYNITEELSFGKDQRNTYIENLSGGGVWLLGEMEDSEIHEVTYSWLWQNILVALKYEKDYMIIRYWENAHQYISRNLQHVSPNHDDTFQKILNEEDIKKRKEDRDRFFEFHFALGGLLLYKKRYSTVNKIFEYTTSIPPRYELLPERMNEIFYLYDQFRDPFDFRSPWISNRYPFPDQTSINSSYVVKKWILSYFALLFLRQYTIVEYLITSKPLDFPVIPKTQNLIRKWIEGIDLFKQLVSEHMANSKLMETLNYNFLTREWCDKNKKKYPINFIEILKSMLEDAYTDGALNLELDTDKIEKFYTYTKVKLEETNSLYDSINNKTEITINYNKWFINGQRMIQTKDVFSKTPEVTHLNFDSFLPDQTSIQIKEGITTTFLLSNSKNYVLKPENIFKAIDKLDPNETYLILNFGINIERYISLYKISDLSSQCYKNIKIINLPRTNTTNNSFFIVKKQDLPNIIHHDIKPELIEKYSLKEISSLRKIYASVLDLNLVDDEIRHENSKENYSDEELKKSALMNIFQSIEIRWKKNIELVELIEYSEFRQMGLPRNLEDVDRLKNE